MAYRGVVGFARFRRRDCYNRGSGVRAPGLPRPGTPRGGVANGTSETDAIPHTAVRLLRSALPSRMDVWRHGLAGSNGGSWHHRYLLYAAAGSPPVCEAGWSKRAPADIDTARTDRDVAVRARHRH